MTNSLKPIKLETIKNLSGKKENKNNIYYYLDFKFNLHKMGDSADGSSLYRIIPVNFDNLLLKTFSKKTFPAKGYSTIESNNIKLTLKNTFDEILRIKAKKESARKAYEKAVKEGTITVEETTPAVSETKKAKKASPKKIIRKKIESTDKPKVAATSYKVEKPASGKEFDKKFGKGRHTKKNEDFKRDRHFEKNESFNFDKENKEKGYSKDKSFTKNKPTSKFDSKDKKKAFDKDKSNNKPGMNKFNKNSREFSKDDKEKSFNKNERFDQKKSSFKKKRPTSKRTNY